MAERTITEAAAYFSQKYGRRVTRRMVERYIYKGLFKFARKIEFGPKKQGVWLISDDELPVMDDNPIQRRAPLGPRERRDRTNAVIPSGFPRKP